MRVDPRGFAPLARLALAIADPRALAVDAALAAALAAGAEPPRIAEAILQGIPYSGFPGAVEALGLLHDHVRFTPLAPRPGVTEDPADPAGLPAAFRAVYRDGASAVRAALRERHPDLERWILGFAYGEVMGRGILSLAELEGLAVGSLVGQRRRTPLHSHLRGALRTGWSAGDLGTLLGTLAPEADAATLAFARAVVARETGGGG